MLTPLPIVADALRSGHGPDRLRVIDDPLRDVPALAAEDGDHLAGREPVYNTAGGGGAA